MFLTTAKLDQEPQVDGFEFNLIGLILHQAQWMWRAAPDHPVVKAAMLYWRGMSPGGVPLRIIRVALDPT
jgi:hypothetical protein